ncbi:MAG: DUF2029 domain-containing protein [Bacteroidia bacterium]|jgi:hypothetical protein|nr:DUF2029 domain-containing protein [Bacteroidia bacterium]
MRPVLRDLLIILLMVTATRLPFIFDGYGVEEDSWGLVVNAYEMNESGEYRASRFPGHPLQEYVYSAVYNQPAWVWNLMSVVMSVAAVMFFHLALRKLKLNTAWPVTLMLSFTPVFFIAGTYTIDYAWTLAFVTGSFWLLCERRFVWSGVFLGLAVGCRLTTAVFVLPWFLLLWNRMDAWGSVKLWLRLAVPAGVIGVLWFVPAFVVYGRAFFDYSDQFPYPPMAKVIYKASIGVFGLAGTVALIFAAVAGFGNWRKNNLQGTALFTERRLLFVCAVIVVLHVFSYLRLPQKAGYMLPMVPFLLLAAGTLLTQKQSWIAAALFMIAPFLFSINLTDPMRGAEASAVAVTFHAAGQEIFLDPLSGPIQSERSKRLNKMAYCSRIMAATDTLQAPSLIICGWWYNELKTEHYTRPQSKNVSYRFYETCAVLDSARQTGARIYYLSEQNLYNDQMFGQQCTDSLAKPFPVK